MAVAAIYGMVTYLTGSILPAVLLHTAGNIYSNTDLWLRGRAEWQASAGTTQLVLETGFDPAFWKLAALVAGLGVVTVWAYFALAASVRRQTEQRVVTQP